MIARRVSRKIKVGSVEIGGDAQGAFLGRDGVVRPIGHAQQ